MMQKWMMIIFAAGMALQACQKQQEEYQITIGLEDASDKWVRLLSLQDRSYVTFDSVLVQPGTPAIMSGKVDGPVTMYLTMEGSGGSVQLLMENADYRISGTLDAPVIETDSKAQGDLNAFNEWVKPAENRLMEMRDAMMEAQGSGETEKVDSLREIYYELYESRDAMDLEYAAGHPTSFASVLALRGTFYSLDAQELDSILSSFDTPLKKLEEYTFMAGKLERMKAVAVGQPYSDIELPTPDGGNQSISDVHNGNVLLVDFWASWCGPCRRANPELVEIYHDYRDRGFDILGISLDRDSASWLKAIQDDNLTWNHISDLNYWDSQAAELYGISAIPHAVLIDREGKIAASGIMQGDDLRKAIEPLL